MQLKLVMENCENWERMSFAQREVIHMVCTKLGRIGDGDFGFLDHWVDLAGYPQLIVEILTKEK